MIPARSALLPLLVLAGFAGAVIAQPSPQRSAATERVTTVDTTAAGGNASLLAGG